MVQRLGTVDWSAPKANVVFILPNTYIEKTRVLLCEFEEIATFNFASMWEIKYGEGVDFVNLKYQGGLIQFLRDNDHLFKLTRDETGTLYVSLVSKLNLETQNNTIIQHEDVPVEESCRTIKRLFNPDNYLWAQLPLHKLLMRKIFIAHSAYELAFMVNAVRAQCMVNMIKQVLQCFPHGLEFSQLYKYLPIEQVLKTFSIAFSLSALIDELPELFYRVKDDSLGIDIVYDASKHTIPDLAGNNDKYFIKCPTPQAIATWAINIGLYQKTLMLILRAGEARGLKVNVWVSSMQLNYYPKNSKRLRRVVGKFGPLTLFLALARYNLVELRPGPESRNDIRAFLPNRYPKYTDIKKRLPCLIDFKCEDNFSIDETEESGIGQNSNGDASDEQSPRSTREVELDSSHPSVNSQ